MKSTSTPACSETVPFSHSAVSNSLRLQHTRLPCPSPIPGACSNSCPLSQWCHPIISSSVVPFSSCLQSFPASESFPMSQFFTSGDQNIGVSASASVLPMNIQHWFPVGLTAWISLRSKGLSRVLSSTTVQKASILPCSAFFTVHFSYPYMTAGKTIALTIWTFVSEVMSLFFNMLSMLVIAFLPRNKRLLISWLQSPSAVMLEPKKKWNWKSLSWVRLCEHMDCSIPGFPVHHQLPELAETHVHWVGDAIQLSQPLSSPFPSAFNLSQHQGFSNVRSLHQVAKVLEFQLQWDLKMMYLITTCS